MSLKKRIIFELLFYEGSFVQSRNFRLQKVGDIEWLMSAYNLSNLAKSVDELVITDLSVGPRPSSGFEAAVEKIIEKVRIPVCLGGGVSSTQSAKQLLNLGADKIIMSSALFENFLQVQKIADLHGKQFVVLSLDWTRDKNGLMQIMKQGGKKVGGQPESLPWGAISEVFGELMLRSIDNDGTGNGLEIRSLELVPEEVRMPLVLAGGIGKPEHIVEGLLPTRVSGVATANLLNFVGTSMDLARRYAIENGINLARFS